jgi:peptidyl-prolyl cis-trans isomerase B (cyclophilin B)
VRLRRRLNQVAWRTCALAGLFALAGCGSGHAAAPQTQNGCTVVSTPKMGPHNESKPTALLPSSRSYAIAIVTNCGSFTISIDQAESPHAAASFVALAQKGFFDHTIFHRIVPGFVIQGGDPTGTGTGGPGYLTVDKPPSDAAYTHGVVAMAKTGAQASGTAGSQFFVVTEANAGLPPDYAIIGKVTSGIAVIDHIGTLGNSSQEPTMVVEIEKTTVSVSG